MKKNGYTIVELLVVFAILGLIVIVTLATTSSALKDNSKEYYEQRIQGIEKMAVLYGKNSELLKTEKNIVITVSDLIKEGYLNPDAPNGRIQDPRNSKASLNSKKIKITLKDDGNIEAEVIED